MKTIKRYYSAKTAAYPASTQSNNNSPKGSAGNPYTLAEFNAFENGTWPGGYVEGMGYVAPDVSIWGSQSGSSDPDSSGSDPSDPWGSDSSDPWASDGSNPNGNNPGGGGGGNTGGTGRPGTSGGTGNSSGGNNSTGQSYSVNKAITYLTTHANNKSVGQCAKYVRLAIEAGGLSTIGHPIAACEYDTFLPKIGFRVVDKNNYSPIIGDIIVLEAVPGHPYGHIAMYNGTNWISDFVQSDMWGGSAYRNKAEYTLFRY